MVVVTLGGCHLLDDLVVCLHHESRKKIMRCFGEVVVRGVVLVLQELQRATLVEQDVNGDKWSHHVRVLELVVSTPCGRV